MNLYVLNVVKCTAPEESWRSKWNEMKWIKNKDPKQQRRQFLITTTTTAATFQAKLDRQPAKEQIEEQKKREFTVWYTKKWTQFLWPMLNGFIVETLIDSFDSFRHWSHYSFRDFASASVNSVFLYSFLLTWYPAINWRVKEQIHECLSVSSGMCLSLPQHGTHWIDSRQFTQVTYKLSFVVVVVYFFLCSHVRLLSTYMYFRI